VISAVDIDTEAKSEFTGFEEDETNAKLIEMLQIDGRVIAVVDKSPLYVEKGGQVGDTGTATFGDETIEIESSFSVGDALCLQLAAKPESSDRDLTIRLNQDRRRDIEKHHTATHIMHWALHEAVDPEAVQQGSLVTTDRLRFDFNSKALDAEQLLAVEKLVNERIVADEQVSWQEVPHADIKEREDIMQFFGDKYGELVRVVQIGGEKHGLDGYSMELCGGTHVRQTGEIGLCAIKSEGAIAAGIRRIEAVCGEHARQYLKETADALVAEAKDFQKQGKVLAAELEAEEKLLSSRVEAPNLDETTAADMPEVSLALAKLREQRDSLKELTVEFKKQIRKRQSKEQAAAADEVLGDWVTAANEANPDMPTIVESLEGDGGLLQEALNGLKKRQFKGVGVIAVNDEDAGKVHIGIAVDKSLTDKFKAGDLLKELAPIVDGRGGGKPEMARGAGSNSARLGEMLEAARERLKL
jgi:alanyl-tRNA synthetase